VSEKKKLSRCEKCGIEGHWATDCKATAMVASTERPKAAKAETSKSVDAFCMKCSEIGRSLKNYYRIADSGATAHMSHNKNWLERPRSKAIVSTFKTTGCTIEREGLVIMTGEKKGEVGGNLFVLDILPKEHTEELMLIVNQRTMT